MRWLPTVPGREKPSDHTLVILSQVYVPDPASVGQHMHDVAVEMARRGWRVVVYTSDRGYEDPTKRYAPSEECNGVHVIRLPWSSLGKSSIAARVLGGSVFLAQASLYVSGLPRVDRLLVSTSPPMCGIAGVALSHARGAPMTFWVMDINPDQIVASGALDARSVPVRAFEWLNRRVLDRAERVIALDRFMVDRLNAKWPIDPKVTVLPPWPHVDADDEPIAHSDNPFRKRLGFGDKRVVMYSGNLSPSHPVETLLRAAERIQGDDRLLFLFIGGGLGREQIARYVREHGLQNVMMLPYQPLSELRYSLSAADVHLISMGDAVVGIVHPCKIYGAMSVGRPILALGPRDSHVGDIVVGDRLGWQVAHGDVDGAVDALHDISTCGADRLEQMGRRARHVAAQRFSKRALLRRFCDLLDGERRRPEPGDAE